jgi:hypothetical protein
LRKKKGHKNGKYAFDNERQEEIEELPEDRE